ncbi:MAG TPA: hypothetical protein PKN80_02700, partial [bacterium]|nr:hypothetical protein [bacterium]
VLMCPQGGDRRDLAAYIKDLLPRVPHGNLFALGMSDNVPSDADFDRVKIVADLVNNYRPA